MSRAPSGDLRVYVPATLSRLRAALTDEQVPVAGGTAFAVSPALQREYPDWTEEDLEYLAMQDAARASLRLLAAERTEGETPVATDGPSLRVVVAVDVPEAAVTVRSDLDRAAVRLTGAVAWRQVAAVHVDGADAGPAVDAALPLVDAADLGDPDAEFAMGSVQDFDLAWYAPGEVRYLFDDQL
nr:hypothetical protein [Nakamurella flava]